MKTDEQIKKIVIAAIRRHSMDIETWKSTRLWDAGKVEVNAELLKNCSFDGNELPILYSYIDSSNWTLFTTKAVYYLNEKQIRKIEISEIKDCKLGNFKGYTNQKVEKMIIQTNDNSFHHCPYETNKPSMGSIYAIRTLLQIS